LGGIGDHDRLGADFERRPAQSEELLAPEPDLLACAQIAGAHAQDPRMLTAFLLVLEIYPPDVLEGQSVEAHCAPRSL
jgi:hypothetical protein